MNAPSEQRGFALHLVFSVAGLHEASTYVCAGDRVLCMYRPVTGTRAGLRLAWLDDDGDGGTSGIDLPGGIDFLTMVQWCAEAPRVVSWP